MDGIRIVYGMPDHEAFLLAEEGKIKLGGCCVSISDPEYYCKACGNEWDRQTAIDHAYEEIKGIKASVGGYFEGYYEVVMDFQSRKLQWKHSGAGSEQSYEMTIGKNILDTFIEELKMLDLLNWRAKYIEPGVCDGTQWSIEIIKNSRNIKKYGENKFPEEWDEFCGAIERISGKNFK